MAYFEESVDFYYHAKNVFENIDTTILKRVTKNTMTGIVNLKDGTTHQLTVKTRLNSKLTIYQHREITE